MNLIWKATPAGAARSVLSKAMFWAVSSRTVADAPPDAAGVGAPEAAGLPAGAALAAGEGPAPGPLEGAVEGDAKASFQQFGTGVAPGAGAKDGSRQPVIVVISPVAGSTPWNCRVVGARTNATSSSMSR